MPIRLSPPTLLLPANFDESYDTCCKLESPCDSADIDFVHLHDKSHPTSSPNVFNLPVLGYWQFCNYFLNYFLLETYYINEHLQFLVTFIFVLELWQCNSTFYDFSFFPCIDCSQSTEPIA